MTLIFWDSTELDLPVVHCSSQLIHCLVQSKDGKFSFLCSFVYAYNSLDLRKSRRHDLAMLQPTITLPQLLLGYGNVVLDSSGKVNAQESPCTVSNELFEILQHLGLI